MSDLSDLRKQRIRNKRRHLRKAAVSGGALAGMALFAAATDPSFKYALLILSIALLIGGLAMYALMHLVWEVWGIEIDP